MKQSFFFLGSLLSLIILSPGKTFAVSTCPSSSVFAPLCNLKLDNTSNVIPNIIAILFTIATVLALLFLIYGGIKWITSGGDKAKLDAARNTITAAVIGLVLVFLSFFILNVVAFLFGIQNVGSFVIPQLNTPQ